MGIFLVVIAGGVS